MPPASDGFVGDKVRRLIREMKAIKSQKNEIPKVPERCFPPRWLCDVIEGFGTVQRFVQQTKSGSFMHRFKQCNGHERHFAERRCGRFALPAYAL